MGEEMALREKRRGLLLIDASGFQFFQSSVRVFLREKIAS